ncbi:hypothetical protein [Streptomyces sp. NPDC059909]|uniref:hypothetical protein n=1 Tax=Streptomyces sp. NPDC059909 TaxID=3346998 RepID=UPI00364D3F2A
MSIDPAGACPPVRPRRSFGRRRMSLLALSAGLSTAVLVGCGSTHQSGEPAAPISGQKMVSLLESLLPQGTSSAQKGRGLTDKPGPPPSAELLFTEGGKAAKVTLNLNTLPVPEPFTQCPDPAFHPHSRCTRTQLPGGARLVLDQSPQDEAKPSEGKILTALLTYKDGRQVYVTAAGNLGGKDASKTASNVPALPLTLAQLGTIARSAVWEPVLSAMPTPQGDTKKDAGAGLTAQQIAHGVKGLLPAKLRVVREGGSDGFGHVTVDDGHGESLVTVNVQRWKPDDPAMAELFGKAAPLPDGTRVSVRKEPARRGGPGAVEWTVDTFRKDGLRVAITAVNAGAYQLPASRSEPALSIEQLKRIALDRTWQARA